MKFWKYFWINSKLFVGFIALVEIFLVVGNHFNRYHNNEPLYVNGAVFIILFGIIVGDYTQWRKKRKR